MEEGKTKTIVWDSNSEPPKNYIWAKDDNGFLEFKDGSWVESEEIAVPGSGGVETIDFFKFIHAVIYPITNKVATYDGENFEIYDIDNQEVFNLSFVNLIYSGDVPDSGNIIYGLQVGKTEGNRYYFEPSFCDIDGAIKENIPGTDMFIFNYV